MRVTHVVARAFGPFRGERLNLAPGMTVVAGPNEAGKTTWHAALRLSLTGLRRGRGRATAAEAALAERHRPWDAPDAWEVEAGLVLDDGRTIELRQDLDGKVACSAIDVGLGRDVSSEILDGTPDASRWLGLDRDAFAVTVSVGQADVMAVTEASAQLQEQMQRAAATRGTDATAAEAIERLAEFRRQAVGAETAHAKGPLRAARLRLAAAVERRDEARERHADLLEEQARVEEAARRVADRRLRLDRALAAQARQQARESAQRARRAGELAGRHAHRPSLASRDASADLVASALVAWERRAPEPAPPDPPSAAIETELQRIPAEPVGDLEPASTVLAAVREEDLARQALALLGDPPTTSDSFEPGDGTRLRSLAQRIRAGSSTSAGGDAWPLRDRGSAGAAAALGMASLALLVGGVALVALGQLVVALAVMSAGLVAGGFGLARVSRSGASGRVGDPSLAPKGAGGGQAVEDAEAAIRETERSGLPADPDALDLLADRALLATRDRELAADWRRRHAELERRQSAAADALRNALAGRGVEVNGEVQDAWMAYRSACDGRARQAAAFRSGEALRAQLAASRYAEQSLAAARAANAETDLRVREAADAVGIAHTDQETEQVAAVLRRWTGERAATLLASQTAIEEWRELQTLLAGGSLEDLAGEAARRAALADELAARTGGAPPESEPAPGASGMDTLIDARRAELAAAEAEASERKGSLESLGRNLPDVAEAEEAVAAATSELARVQASARTIDETLKLLRQAQERVHRDLAPILAGAVRRWLPAVSGGAYEEVSVDPADLSIQVKESQTGIWRSARLLSEGTREQIYLLLRVAMAQHLVTSGETAPLILDEVTAQSDGERRAVLLSVLHQLSTERQVILFSHDPEVAAWAEDTLAEPADALVRLPSLTTGAGATRKRLRRAPIAIGGGTVEEPAAVAG